METDIQIICKYLVEKSQILFTKKKQVMSICTDRLLLQGLDTNIHTLSDYEEIHYGSIKDIKASANNSTDFSVIADKKYDFSCEYRNRLIWELKHEVSQYQEWCDWDLFYWKLLFDIYNPSKIRIDFIVLNFINKFYRWKWNFTSKSRYTSVWIYD